MSGGTDTLKGANVSKCIPRPLLANSCEVRFSETGFSFRDGSGHIPFIRTWEVINLEFGAFACA